MRCGAADTRQHWAGCIPQGWNDAVADAAMDEFYPDHPDERLRTDEAGSRIKLALDGLCDPEMQKLLTGSASFAHRGKRYTISIARNFDFMEHRVVVTYGGSRTSQ